MERAALLLICVGSRVKRERLSLVKDGADVGSGARVRGRGWV
jgi:hypothetical protein